MIIVGIDTSCDDTSVALLEAGSSRRLLSSIVSSQVDLHSHFGGIVPEIASRKHVELIDRIFFEALREAGLAVGAIDAVAVTNGPGLIGSLLVGLSFAKGLVLAVGKPLVPVNHITAHALSVFLERDIDFPFVALVVSGGHTLILLVSGHDELKVLGSTRDDAAGEAFDKAAKFLGLGYPGGRIIEERGARGRKDFVTFPRPMMDDKNYDFSFSGLKTSFINYIKNNPLHMEMIDDILSSFQEAVVDVLVTKTIRAARDEGVRTIVVGGGVACNGRLRTVFAERVSDLPLDVFFSAPQYCTDNGAMIALAGSFALPVERGYESPLDVKAFSRMRLAR